MAVTECLEKSLKEQYGECLLLQHGCFSLLFTDYRFITDSESDFLGS